jgi:glucosamine-6-phosphate deaminase
MVQERLTYTVLSRDEIATHIAEEMAALIKERNDEAKPTVFGLATGSTPVGIYRELVRLHKEGLDFSNVIAFNLDEYEGLPADHGKSYHAFMREHLFDHVNIKEENIYIPDGMTKDPKAFGRWYEDRIHQMGGIDIQILGIGRDGHIGFNEPGSSMTSKTRRVKLDERTRTDALSSFGDRKYVPTHAITMGVATILAARRIFLIATGEHKAAIVQKAIEEEPSKKVVASYLQQHDNVSVLLDPGAAGELTRFKTPWLTGDADWSNQSVCERALCYVSEQEEKPIAKIRRDDLKKYNMTGMVEKLDTIKKQLLKAFEQKYKPLPSGKKVIVFSPHPDDDIISMGGALRKLVEQDNEVYVAYMTQGYTAVFDHEVVNFINARKLYEKAFGKKDGDEKLYAKVLDFLDKKHALEHGLPDIEEVKEIKTLVREVEAIAVCDFVDVSGYAFLRLPFYRNRGDVTYDLVVDEELVLGYIKKIQPDIIFAAGDLADPNGTHRTCLQLIEAAHLQYDHPHVLWLYRGAWQEYHPLAADVFVSLSVDEVRLKREGIFRHESQKDKPPQPGPQQGEFWQRAERRNAETARLLRCYGVSKDKAVEAFQVVR